MHDFLHLFIDVLRNSVLITGLVIVMMLMLEYININSQGKLFGRLRKNRFGQVVLGAGLGIIPGCMGGFAAVSMYSHKLLSFGALVAMMIASSGDEAFVMLAMIPKQALILSGVLFVVAIATGWIVDRFKKAPKESHPNCDEGYQIHDEDHHHEGEKASNDEKPSFRNLKHASAERVALLLGVMLFISALGFGMLEHEHDHEGHAHDTEMVACHEHEGHLHLDEHAAIEPAQLEMEEEHHHESHLNIFDERWMNILFAIISLLVVYFIATTSEHIIKEHLWDHIIRKHFLSIFLWTFGALLVIEIGLHYFDIESWISSNIMWMILLAVLVGIIPESGPHMLFVTLFASGVVPFSVLLASSISQDGHASLPLLAESKKSFAIAKVINALVAALCGYVCYFVGF